MIDVNTLRRTRGCITGVFSEINLPGRRFNSGETLGQQLKDTVKLTYEPTGFVYALDVPLSLTKPDRPVGLGEGALVGLVLPPANAGAGFQPSGLGSGHSFCRFIALSRDAPQ
jgi:hypothetical protein